MQALGAKPEEDAPLLKIAPLPEELQTANVSAEAKKMQALSDKARSKEKKERNRTQKLKPRREFVETQEVSMSNIATQQSISRKFLGCLYGCCLRRPSRVIQRARAPYAQRKQYIGSAGRYLFVGIPVMFLRNVGS